MLPTELKRVLEEWINEDGLTNSIGYQKTESLDDNKTTIYPFLNMDFISVRPNYSVLDYNIMVTILEKRQNDGKLTADVKTDFKNYDDNINDTFVIANMLISNIYKSEELESLVAPDVLFLKSFGVSDLDGVQFSLTLRVNNDLECL